MQETLYQAAFRCVAKYAYGTFLKSLINLAAFVGVSAVVSSWEAVSWRQRQRTSP